MKFSFILMPILIVVIISLFFGKIFNSGEKIDKGIEFCYWKLSYRRRFIRTLWMFPIFIIVMVLFHVTFLSYILTGIIGAVLCIALLVQAIYNYEKWNKEER